ncbi:hypothetical protein BDV28DRAFT_91129 [Aspergillus coremiiformis]|uniref:Thioredoxin-like protein n=1 Tax=Aspergillus coremiiformis TaxID=138285 RepID=A0A5N6Z965_9EURO|nr:hypothetical protein BDV28DRAFT_91129 [Aspergillus coremiiformis]
MSDSTLYLYTSLTAGSSHIVTATARLETILKANKLPFRAIDVATDDPARKLWGRRSKGRKLPGLVKFGTVVGDLEEIEEWNEYGELRMQVNNVEDFGDSIPTMDTAPPAIQPEPGSAVSTPVSETPVPKQSTIKIQNPPAKASQKDDSIKAALRQASEEKKEGGADSVRRKSSVAPEIVTEGNPKRPPLVPEIAAVSSANFHADNAEALGLVEHHRGSIVSATSPEEKAKVAQDIRKSISGGHAEMLESLRDDQAQKADQEETVDEESESGEDVEAAMNRKAKKPDSS